MKRTSKFVGNDYQGWTCTRIFLAANYSKGTKHNKYRYMLERITSDQVCKKKIVVSCDTMTKISRGLVNIEKLADKKGSRQTNYEFIVPKQG